MGKIGNILAIKKKNPQSQESNMRKSRNYKGQTQEFTLFLNDEDLRNIRTNRIFIYLFLILFN